jgi:hypothetical protein
MAASEWKFGWFKMLGLIVILSYFFGDYGDDTNIVVKQQSSSISTLESTQVSEPEVKTTPVKPSETDKWWELTDKYAICYGNVTKAHKVNGLHERNRSLSVQIKEEICKIAATSTTGEGCVWLSSCGN